ncbi:unnamed protein product, partial [marine sediment metagenome]
MSEERVGQAGQSRQADGSKAQQRGEKDKEDRSLIYRLWHRDIGPQYYVEDVDQVEWRRGKDGELHPVAVIELTRHDPNPEYPDGPDER